MQDGVSINPREVLPHGISIEDDSILHGACIKHYVMYLKMVPVWEDGVSIMFHKISHDSFSIKYHSLLKDGVCIKHHEVSLMTIMIYCNAILLHDICIEYPVMYCKMVPVISIM